jgi:hypothetical protein
MVRQRVSGTAEIADYTVSKASRFADIKNSALLVLHNVYTGELRQALSFFF